MNYEQSLFLTISQPKTDKTVVNSLPFFKKKVHFSETAGKLFYVRFFAVGPRYCPLSLYSKMLN